jgi:hypothetical protein
MELDNSRPAGGLQAWPIAISRPVAHLHQDPYGAWTDWRHDVCPKRCACPRDQRDVEVSSGSSAWRSPTGFPVTSAACKPSASPQAGSPPAARVRLAVTSPRRPTPSAWATSPKPGPYPVGEVRGWPACIPGAKRDGSSSAASGGRAAAGLWERQSAAVHSAGGRRLAGGPGSSLLGLSSDEPRPSIPRVAPRGDRAVGRICTGESARWVGPGGSPCG